MLRRPRLALVAAPIVAVGLALVTACAPSDGRTALAAREPRWRTPGVLVVEVECADDVDARVDPRRGVHGTPLVTIWGTPNRDGCWTEVDLWLLPGTIAVEDAATGTLLELPPRPPA